MKKILIIGGSGNVGANLYHFFKQKDLNVFTLSRRHTINSKNNFSVDLGNEKSIDEFFKKNQKFDEIIYSAYYHSENVQDIHDKNIEMFSNLLSSIQKSSISSIKNFMLVEGTKWYGSHLGEFKTPAKETDDVKKNHFYHYQQNLLESVAKKNNFSWIAIRPHTVCSNVIGFPMNLALIISIYASICKYKNLKFTFPGNLQNWNSVYQVTSAKILSDAIYWLLNNDKCKNNAFNLTNGDFFRWKNIWPRIANHYNLDWEIKEKFSLAEFISSEKDIWKEISIKFNLQAMEIEKAVNWNFGDFIFSSKWDIMSDCTKLRKAGYNLSEDSEQMFLKLLSNFKENQHTPY